MWACGLADTCRSTMKGREPPSGGAFRILQAGHKQLPLRRSNCSLDLPLDRCSATTHSVNSMPKDRRIIITETDFNLLNRLASHPHLAAELDKAAVVDSRLVPSDVVTMNSRVLFEDESTGERHKVTIVFPQQADPSKAFVSVLAPVGTALLGLAAGQSIVWPFPDGGTRSLRVLQIIYQPQADEAPNPRMTEKRPSAPKAG